MNDYNNGQNNTNTISLENSFSDENIVLPLSPMPIGRTPALVQINSKENLLAGVNNNTTDPPPNPLDNKSGSLQQ